MAMARTGVLAQVLGDFQNQAEGLAGALVDGLVVSRAFRIAGRWPVNSTSTTAPMTWATAHAGAGGDNWAALPAPPCGLGSRSLGGGGFLGGGFLGGSGSLRRASAFVPAEGFRSLGAAG